MLLILNLYLLFPFSSVINNFLTYIFWSQLTSALVECLGFVNIYFARFAVWPFLLSGQQNWHSSRTRWWGIKINPTQVSDKMSHPVYDVLPSSTKKQSKTLELHSQVSFRAQPATQTSNKQSCTWRCGCIGSCRTNPSPIFRPWTSKWVDLDSDPQQCDWLPETIKDDAELCCWLIL